MIIYLVMKLNKRMRPDSVFFFVYNGSKEYIVIKYNSLVPKL